jgi:hypothetical protein
MVEDLKRFGCQISQFTGMRRRMILAFTSLSGEVCSRHSVYSSPDANSSLAYPLLYIPVLITGLDKAHDTQQHPSAPANPPAPFPPFKRSWFFSLYPLAWRGANTTAPFRCGASGVAGMTMSRRRKIGICAALGLIASLANGVHFYQPFSRYLQLKKEHTEVSAIIEDLYRRGSRQSSSVVEYSYHLDGKEIREKSRLQISRIRRLFLSSPLSGYSIGNRIQVLTDPEGGLSHPRDNIDSMIMSQVYHFLFIELIIIAFLILFYTRAQAPVGIRRRIEIYIREGDYPVKSLGYLPPEHLKSYVSSSRFIDHLSGPAICIGLKTSKDYMELSQDDDRYRIRSSIDGEEIFIDSIHTGELKTELSLFADRLWAARKR